MIPNDMKQRVAEKAWNSLPIFYRNLPVTSQSRKTIVDLLIYKSINLQVDRKHHTLFTDILH